MSDDEINEIPPERVLDRESVLRAKLKEALQDRDEARRERDELRKNYLALVEEWKKSVFRLARERDEARRERDEARRQASVWEKLALREASINGAKLCAEEEE